MAKNEKTTYPGNSRGFNAGSTPKKFGPTDDSKAPSSENNKIGGVSEPQESKNKPGVTKDVLSYKDPSLASVAMPNNKGGEVNKGIFKNISDYPTTVGGSSRPNTIS